MLVLCLLLRLSSYFLTLSPVFTITFFIPRRYVKLYRQRSNLSRASVGYDKTLPGKAGVRRFPVQPASALSFLQQDVCNDILKGLARPVFFTVFPDVDIAHLRIVARYPERDHIRVPVQMLQLSRQQSYAIPESTAKTAASARYSN
jgi:hypothetical protein